MELNSIKALDQAIYNRLSEIWLEDVQKARDVIASNLILSKVKVKFGEQYVSLSDAILDWPNFNNVAQLKAESINKTAEAIAAEMLKMVEGKKLKI